jgi:hypothetical protein
VREHDHEPAPERPAGALEPTGSRARDIEPLVRLHYVTRKNRPASLTRSSPEMSIGSSL